MGDSSDNIKPCNIDIGYLENGIANGIFKPITKFNISRIIDDDTKYKMMLDMLMETRVSSISDISGISNISNDRRPHKLNIISNFTENARLIDFQLIPDNIKQQVNNELNKIGDWNLSSRL